MGEEEDSVLTAIGMRVRTVPLLSAHLLLAGDEWIQISRRIAGNERDILLFCKLATI